MKVSRAWEAQLTWVLTFSPLPPPSAVLVPNKGPPSTLWIYLPWLQNQSGGIEEETIFCPLPGVKPLFLCCLAHSLVTKSTELYRFNAGSKTVETNYPQNKVTVSWHVMTYLSVRLPTFSGNILPPTLLNSYFSQKNTLPRFFSQARTGIATERSAHRRRFLPCSR